MKSVSREGSRIRNKVARRRVVLEEKAVKKKDRREARKSREKERERLGSEAPPKQEPRTLENSREHDETIVRRGDEAVAEAEQVDEFAGVFSGEVAPKVLVTTGYRATRVTYEFLKDFVAVIPNIVYYKRGRYELKKIVKYATSKGFTDVIVVREDHKLLTGLVHCHLPDGPTAEYRLTSYLRSGRIRNRGKSTSHTPEVILNNFTTRLGRRVGRMIGALFPHNPEFRGRQAVTIHNQRDFLFFRFHRYVFSEAGERVRLQELGPRFTLKLKSLQGGTFDPAGGEFEWIQKKDMVTSRRRFVL